MSPQSGSTQPCRRLFIAAVPDIRHVHQTNGEASMSENSAAFVSLSADVVAAYVSNNSVTHPISRP
jgi:hypothetical protein